MKTIAKNLLAVFCSAFLASIVHAELVATPLPGDTRLVQFPYNEDNTYLVLTKPKSLTHLQFAADEVISTTAAGDTAQWIIEVTKNRKNIFVKPRYEKLETSLTVLTDKRQYEFVLKSNAEGQKWYQRVVWEYQNPVVLELESPLPVVDPVAVAAQSPAATMAGIDPKNIKFEFNVDGDAAFRPTAVFDDGKFTYLKMPSDLQELPALFAVIEDQQYSLVNYTVNGDYLVAQRVLDSAVLKLGKLEVHVERKKPRVYFAPKMGDGR